MTASSLRSRIMTVLLGAAACLVVSYIVLYPDQILASSLEGLTVWWKIVFPALLPFFIILEIMTALGVMHFFGSMLDPVMRRLFRLPGIAGWCLAVGWTAGAPASTGQIAELRRVGRLTRAQAERLLTLAHAGSPVLLIIVIASGFIGDPRLGLPLLIIHWLSAIIAAAVGGLRRADPETDDSFEAHGIGVAVQEQQFHADSPNDYTNTGGGLNSHNGGYSQPGLIRRSILAMEQARAEDGRLFGRLLGDSVFDSIQKLMVIGGYMIFFSVILKIGMLTAVGDGIMQLLDRLSMTIGLPNGITNAFISGLFEQHLGAYALHDTMPGVWMVAAISGVLGWSGLCMHAQVKATLAGTDIRYVSFLLSRLTHAVAGFILSLILYPLLIAMPSIVPGFEAVGDAAPVWTGWIMPTAAFPSTMAILQMVVWMLIAAIGALATLSAVSAAIVAAGGRKR